MPKQIAEKLNDFSGYTSIHGVGRIGGVKYWFMKILWTLAFMASFGMCIYQVYRLGKLYVSNPVNTIVETENGVLDFPGVSFCNLNPMKYTSVKKEELFFQIIEMTAKDWSIDLAQFETNGNFVNPNYTYSRTINVLGQGPLTFGKKLFKLRMGELTTSALKQMSQQFTEFVISRKFGGEDLDISNFTVVRDEDYGICYTLNLTEETRKAEIAGSSFGLELILNVQQDEYVPFVTESAGIRLAIHNPNSKPLFSTGISLPTGFEVNVGMTVVDNSRLPGTDNKCDANNSYSNIQSCIESCIGQKIATDCKCVHQFQYVTTTITLFCSTQADFDCMDEVMRKVPTACSKCKVPCNERDYRRSISMTRWPSGNYEPVLKQIISEFGMNINKAREDCLLLRVYFSSLTKETVKEELAYTEENFVSDIGGQLGLWAGISVLSLLELVELLGILITALFCRKDSRVDGISSNDLYQTK